MKWHGRVQRSGTGKAPVPTAEVVSSQQRSRRPRQHRTSHVALRFVPRQYVGAVVDYLYVYAGAVVTLRLGEHSVEQSPSNTAALQAWADCKRAKVKVAVRQGRAGDHVVANHLPGQAASGRRVSRQLREKQTAIRSVCYQRQQLVRSEQALGVLERDSSVSRFDIVRLVYKGEELGAVALGGQTNDGTRRHRCSLPLQRAGASGAILLCGTHGNNRGEVQRQAVRSKAAQNNEI